LFFQRLSEKGNLMAKVAIVYHSGFGHTKLQAEAVHRGAAGVAGVQAHLLTTDEAAARLDDLDTADAIIFGCPTYMGNMSAEMKKFIEVAAKKWFTLAWKDKISGVFTNSSSFAGDKLNTLVGLTINAMQHGMIHVSLGINPAANHPESMGTPEGPGPAAHNRHGSFIGPTSASFQLKPPTGPVPGDIETAEAYGRRVATITVQFLKGRA
jgi:NAD(P)H dehydrogenase (quinone)